MSTVAIREDTLTPMPTEQAPMPHAPMPHAPMPVSDAMVSLAQWAQQLDAAMRIARALATTTFVPKAFRGKPEECAAAILTGHDFGFSPTASFRAFYPVDGRVEMYAAAMKALIISRGHEVWVAEQSDQRVVMRGRRRGSEHVQEVVWDLDRARQAGLLGKDNWKHYPQQMLEARATAQICRSIAPDVLLGVYAVEEMIDEPIPATADTELLSGADIIATAAQTTTAESTPDEPQAQHQLEPEPEPQRVAPKPSEAAMKRMFAKLAAAGLGGKDRRELALEWISQTLGREITSRDQLTAADVKRVCDALDQLEEERDSQAPAQA